MIPVPVQTVASVLVVTPVQTATSVLAVATLRQPDQAEKVPKMIAVPVQTAASVLAVATLHQPDQAEKTQIQQSINQALQKAGKRWILKHS